MGALGGFLGTAGGAGGTGYSAPQTVPVIPGTNTNQLDTSYYGNQNSLASQQALLAALQSQNGLGTQNVATSQQMSLANQLAGNNAAANQANAYGQTQNLANQLGTVNGTANLNSALLGQQGLAGQQQATAAQLQGIANGTGPNPAMAALNQATGQNVANQAALMAGQRGAAQNVGLIARDVAQQQAADQQQAAGQGATLQAQQSLGALQNLGAQQQAIGQTQQNVANIGTQQIGLQQAQQQALANQAATQLGQQQAQQQALANQANTVAGQQIAGTGSNTAAQQSEQQLLQNALAAQNQANVSQQGNINTSNTGLATTTMGNQQNFIGGGLNGIGSLLGGAGAKGGIVKKPKKMAEGGDSSDPVSIPQPIIPNPGLSSQPGPISSFGKFLQGFTSNSMNQNANNQNSQQMFNTGNSALGQGTANFIKGIGSQFKSTPNGAPDTSSVGNNPSPLLDAGNAVEAVAAKGGMMKKHDYRTGGNVKAKNPKEKAVKSGNSYANDKIPAVLSEGEVVIPRSVMQSKDPVRSSAEFVARVLAKRGKK